MDMGKLTVREIEIMLEGSWKSDGTAGTARMGSLVFRREKEAIHGYFRYAIGRTSKVWLIGLFDKTGKRGMTLSQMRDEAARLARLRQEGHSDLRVYFHERELAKTAEQEERRKQEDQAMEQQRAEAEARAREAEQRARYTLRILADTYLSHLQITKQPATAQQAKSIFNCHLFKPFPELCKKPAREITPLIAASIIRECVQAGNKRTPGQLRSYLSSAYNLAIRAPLSTTTISEFDGFNIEANPFSVVQNINSATRHRTLTDNEIYKYLTALFTNELADMALLLHVLSAGQRLGQLLRVKVSDWDPMTSTLRLWDLKGRRHEPREHLVPLGPYGCEIIKLLLERAANSNLVDPPLFASKGSTLNTETCIQHCHRIGDWTPGDVRRTAETRLAGLGVSKDHRAQLLSHGIFGVQALHYDRHSYIDEKKNALITWENHLGEILDKGGMVNSS